MFDPLDLIHRLAAAGAAAPEEEPEVVADGGGGGGTPDDADTAALLLLTDADVASIISAAPDLWFEATGSGVRTEDISRALRHLMRARPLASAVQAGRVLVALLQVPGCPTLGLLDRLNAFALCSLVRDAGLGGGGGSGGKAGKGARGRRAVLPDTDGLPSQNPFSPSPTRTRRRRGAAADADDEDDAEEPAGVPAATAEADPAHVAALLAGLASVLGAFGLADQPDTLRATVDAAADVARSVAAPAVVAESACAVLTAVVHPRHGPPEATLACLLRGVAPGLAGSEHAAGRGAARTPAAVREGLVRLAGSLMACHPDAAAPAVAAAARFALLAAPDRAEARAGAAAGAAALASALPWEETAALARFGARLARSARISHRSGLVDFAVALLDEPGMGGWAEPPPSVAAPAAAAESPPASPMAMEAGPATVREPWAVTALAALLGRASDRAPTVRAKALAALAGLLTAADEGAAKVGPGSEAAGGRRDALVSALGRLGGAAPTPTTPTTPSSSPLTAALALARTRAGDDKATVRRAGVVLMDALLSCKSSPPPSPPDLAALEAAAGDAMVSVRRGGMAALGRAMRGVLGRDAAADVLTFLPLAATWVRSVLPLARDVEPLVADAAAEEVGALLLGPVLQCGGAEAALRVPAAACVLAALDAGGAGARVCVGRAAARLHSLGRLAARATATALQAFLEAGLPGASVPHALAAAASRGAWALLAELASADPAAPDWRFLRRQWDGLCGGDAAAPLTPSPVAALRVVSRAAARFPPADAAALAGNLEAALATFSLDPAAAAAHATALGTLVPVAGADAVGGWDGRLLAAAEATLAAAVASLAPGGVGGSAAARPAAAAACVAGEVALLRGRPLPRRVVALLEALAAPGAAAAAAAEVAAMVDGGDGGGEQVGAAPAPAPAPTPSTIPSPLRAVAWIALGKACLADEAAAARLLPLFVAALASDAAPAVRNNAMVALADMCAAYTALVDAHVPSLAGAVGDAHPLVRKQALALLADLLQRDYVRWRGPVFLRLLLALADPAPDVAGLAGHLLSDALATKAPLLAYNHFVEAVFVLNGAPVRGGGVGGGNGSGGSLLAGAPGLDALLGGEEAGRAGGEEDEDAPADANLASSSLPSSATATTRGPSPPARARRATIYRELLTRMAPEHRFATAARLCADVLGEALDGIVVAGGAPAGGGPAAASTALALPDEVVRDALVVLASPEIRVAPVRSGGGGGRGAAAAAADAEDEAEAAAAAVAAEGGDVAAMRAVARGRVLGALMKKHLADAMLPVLVDLKRTLEAARSPLATDLARTLRALLRDHQRDLVDLLGGDRTLAAEVAWDIQQADAADAAAAVAGAGAGAAPAPSAAMPAAHADDGAAVAAALAAAPAARPASAALRGSPLVRPGSAHRAAGVDTAATPAAAEVLAAVAAEVAAGCRGQENEEGEGGGGERGPARTPTPAAAGAAGPAAPPPRRPTPCSAGGRAWTPGPSRLRASLDGGVGDASAWRRVSTASGWPAGGGALPPHRPSGGGGSTSPALTLPRLHSAGHPPRPSSGGGGLPGALHHHCLSLDPDLRLSLGGDGSAGGGADPLRLSIDGVLPAGTPPLPAAAPPAADVVLPSPLAAVAWNVPPEAALGSGGSGGGGGGPRRRSTPGGGATLDKAGGSAPKRKASASPMVSGDGGRAGAR